MLYLGPVYTIPDIASERRVFISDSAAVYTTPQ
jgi:hypothetical protein